MEFILLKGEGMHQHVLHGTIDVKDSESSQLEYSVLDDHTILRHERPDGAFGEHKSLRIEKGEWVRGRQVEFNPFSGNNESVWD